MATKAEITELLSLGINKCEDGDNMVFILHKKTNAMHFANSEMDKTTYLEMLFDAVVSLADYKQDAIERAFFKFLGEINKPENINQIGK